MKLELNDGCFGCFYQYDCGRLITGGYITPEQMKKPFPCLTCSRLVLDKQDNYMENELKEEII